MDDPHPWVEATFETSTISSFRRSWCVLRRYRASDARGAGNSELDPRRRPGHAG
jgi:hypothetical protein